MTTQQSKITFKTVFEKEREIIKQQRENRKDTNLDEKAPDTLIGLAISGGGIRSASFALGVLQSLDKNNKLRSVDYLSTVSGGGYIGASLTWFNYLNKKKYSSWTFPFALGPGTRNSTGVSEEIPLDFLRQHGDYLLPNGITSLALLSVALRNMLLSISVYLAAIVSIIFLTFNLFQPVKWVWPFSELWPDSSASVFVQGMLIVIILFGFTTFLYAWMTSLSRLTVQTQEFSYKGRVWFQKHQGLLIALTLASGLLALLPLINTYVLEKLHNISYMASFLPTIMGIAGAIIGYMQRRHGQRVSSDSLALATSSLLIFGILIIGYKIAYDWNNSPDPFLFGTIIFVILLAGWFVNLNLFGIGRMDRDRLMEAYLPNQDAVNVNKWKLATEADVTYFTSVSGANEWGPYHLINANIVLVDSEQVKYKGRGGDNFFMSHLYCGGDAIGYHKMTEFEGGQMTLATAMSISGAALNPNAANSGQGATRNRMVSFILSFLNIRLGFWIGNPAASPLKKTLVKWNSPNFFYPGLLQGLLGKGLDENASYLELTDGGHFDNTGLYELIRRRVDIIYFSSAGADPNFTLDDVGSILVRIQVDFGVTIKFEDELETLMPSTDLESAYGKRFLFSQSGYSVGTIHYPASGAGPVKVGRILMIRATLIKDLPPQIYSYRAQHDEFPNESTTDQFFNETQLEAYRELGLKLTDQLCRAPQ